MKAFITGSLATLLMTGVGLFWWQGRAEVEEAAPPPDHSAQADIAPDPDILPITDPGEMQGPAPPEASELTKEQRRFFVTIAIAIGASRAVKCFRPAVMVFASSIRMATTFSLSKSGP